MEFLFSYSPVSSGYYFRCRCSALSVESRTFFFSFVVEIFSNFSSDCWFGVKCNVTSFAVTCFSGFRIFLEQMSLVSFLLPGVPLCLFSQLRIVIPASLLDFKCLYLDQ